MNSIRQCRFRRLELHAGLEILQIVFFQVRMVGLEITADGGLIDDEMTPESFAPVTRELKCVSAADKVLDFEWYQGDKNRRSVPFLYRRHQADRFVFR